MARGEPGRRSGARPILARWAGLALAGVAAAVALTLWLAPAPAPAPALRASAYASTTGATDVMVEAAQRFGRDARIAVGFEPVPSGDYDAMVREAAEAGALPDVVMIDGPNMAAYVQAGWLRPLDDLVDPAILGDLTGAVRAQGTYEPDGRLYCAAPTDAALSILGNRAHLDAAGVRVPRGIDDAWSLAEFEAALAALDALDAVGWPLDIKRNYGVGEWVTYSLTPIVWSMGGDLIDRGNWRAEGVLDGPETVAALEMLGRWQREGWIAPASADDAAFVETREVALSLVANWGVGAARDRLGEDFVLLPMPDFGRGPVAAMGSWCWAISRDASDPPAAGALVEALLAPDVVRAMSDVALYPPGRLSVLEATPDYAPGGALRLYQEQLDRIAVPRPAHPAYSLISAAFAQAVQDVLGGAEATAALDRAALIVDAGIRAADGYPPFGR